MFRTLFFTALVSFSAATPRCETGTGPDCFGRIGSGCCRRSIAPNYAEVPTLLVTPLIEAPMTRGKCRKFCESTQGCYGFEVDTADSHPKCELQLYDPLIMVANDEAPGCTFGTISCWSKYNNPVQSVVEEEGCIAADTLVEGQDGPIRAGDVTVGSKVLGISGEDASEKWCDVISVTFIGIGEVKNGFTPDHFVIDMNANHTIVQHSALGATNGVTGRNMTLVNILSDCEGLKTSDETVFTPFSTQFCDVESMTWEQYRAVYAGILSLIRPENSDHKNEFLMNPSLYHDNASNPFGTTFKASLPGLCAAISNCALADTASSESCRVLDMHTKALIDFNVNEDTRTYLQAEMPISRLVAGAAKKSWVTDIVIASGVAVTGIVLIVGATLAFRRRRSRAEVAAKQIDIQIDESPFSASTVV